MKNFRKLSKTSNVAESRWRHWAPVPSDCGVELLPAHGPLARPEDVAEQLGTDERGQPVPRALLDVLLPACAEWAKLAKKAAAEKDGMDGRGSSKPSSGVHKSSTCVLL